MLVIPESTKEYFEGVESVVHQNSRRLYEPWQKAMSYCHTFGCSWAEPERALIFLYKDFAPLSFIFQEYRMVEKPEECRISMPDLWESDLRTGKLIEHNDKFYSRGLFGGLIYQGPDVPADGSFPSLTVSLGDTTKIGWFMHT